MRIITTWIVTVWKAYFCKLQLLVFPVAKFVVCILKRSMRNLNLKICPSKNTLRGHTLRLAFLHDNKVTWLTGGPTERRSREWNSCHCFFWRSNVLHPTFQCGSAKFKTEGLSPFLSCFRQELLAWLRPSLRRSVHDIAMFHILK